jgi:hypothetical protein
MLIMVFQLSQHRQKICNLTCFASFHRFSCFVVVIFSCQLKMVSRHCDVIHFEQKSVNDT